MHYVCSECGKPIGLMADKTGTPHLFVCAHTGRVAKIQVAQQRPTIQRATSLRRQGFQHVPAE